MAINMTLRSTTPITDRPITCFVLRTRQGPRPIRHLIVKLDAATLMNVHVAAAVAAALLLVLFLGETFPANRFELGDSIAGEMVHFGTAGEPRVDSNFLDSGEPRVGA